MNSEATYSIILGLGERSTQYYVKQLHKRYLEKYKNFATLPHILFQTDFNAINPFLPDQFDTLIPNLTTILSEVEKLPVKNVLVPNITLHETLDQIETNLKFIHPVKLTVEYLKARHLKNVVIFGTSYTMNSNYIKNAFKAEGISVSEVDKEHQKEIDHLRKSLYAHDATEIELAEYIDLVKHYTNKTIVIACTELSIVNALLKPKNSVDMAELQIKDVLKTYNI
jgi:aspartate racemase